MKQIISNFKSYFSKASEIRKLYAFMVCVVLSTFFWVLNSLSNNYKTEIAFDVIYTQSDMLGDKVIMNDLPKSIYLKVKGIGFDLMNYKLRWSNPKIDIDLSLITSKTQSNLNQSIEKSSISTNLLKSKISSQLKQQVDLESIYPDSIQLITDVYIEKEVKIIPRLTISYKKQFQLDGDIKVEPVTVNVVGPKSILDTLKGIFTEHITYADLSQSLAENLTFDPYYENHKIQFIDKKAILHVPVSKYTETSTTVQLTYLNVPDSISIKAIPDKVEIKYLLPLNKISKQNGSPISAFIDFNDIKENFNSKLKVNVSNYPDYINSIIINPVKVEYILKKRK